MTPGHPIFAVMTKCKWTHGNSDKLLNGFKYYKEILSLAVWQHIQCKNSNCQGPAEVSDALMSSYFEV